MSTGTNTFVVSGNAGMSSCRWHALPHRRVTLTLCPQFTETKNIHDIAPSILKQLNQEQLAKLLAQQQQSGDMPGLVSDE